MKVVLNLGVVDCEPLMMTIRPIPEMTPVQALSHLDACMFCSFG